MSGMDGTKTPKTSNSRHGSYQTAGSLAGPPPALDLETLGLAATLAAMRATGTAPRLSDLIAAQPDSAGALANAVMAEMAAAADVGDLEMLPPEPAHRGAAIVASQQFDALVAEASASYGAPTSEAEGETTAASEAMSLLALAHERGFDAARLAAEVMLSSTLIDWLDCAAIPIERQPDALVFHLVGALSVERARISRALAAGASDADTGDVLGIIAADPSLTPLQRDYWLTLLAADE
jgi:hypothetical protein